MKLQWFDAQKRKAYFDIRLDSKECSAIIELSKGSVRLVLMQQILAEILER